MIKIDYKKEEKKWKKPKKAKKIEKGKTPSQNSKYQTNDILYEIAKTMWMDRIFGTKKLTMLLNICGLFQETNWQEETLIFFPNYYFPHLNWHKTE